MADWNPAMKRRTLGVLLVASLAVAAVATVDVLSSVALIQVIGQHRCEIGFRNLIIGCTFKSSRTITSPATNTSDHFIITKLETTTKPNTTMREIRRDRDGV
jgi:hypothetical protein